jgi:hypothetical protein
MVGTKDEWLTSMEYIHAKLGPCGMVMRKYQPSKKRSRFALSQ